MKGELKQQESAGDRFDHLSDAAKIALLDILDLVTQNKGLIKTLEKLTEKAPEPIRSIVHKLNFLSYKKTR